MSFGPGPRKTQDITYWAPGSTVDDYNQPTFAAPVLMSGRWIESQAMVTDPHGQQILSRAHVYLDGDVKIKGYLAEGDLRTDPDPRTVGALEIQQFTSMPDLRFMQQERKAFL